VAPDEADRQGGSVYLHPSAPANLQVLMTARTGVSNWPKNAELRAWLEPALKFEE
jgi:hypothetical protein